MKHSSVQSYGKCMHNMNGTTVTGDFNTRFNPVVAPF
jgi:hypothetical protein